MGITTRDNTADKQEDEKGTKTVRGDDEDGDEDLLCLKACNSLPGTCLAVSPSLESRTSLEYQEHRCMSQPIASLARETEFLFDFMSSEIDFAKVVKKCVPQRIERRAKLEWGNGLVPPLPLSQKFVSQREPAAHLMLTTFSVSPGPSSNP